MTTCAPNRVFAARVAVVQHQRKSVVVYSNGAINPDIKKDEAKVVDTVVASELAKPMVAYCRCWRSSTFPLCNGKFFMHLNPVTPPSLLLFISFTRFSLRLSTSNLCQTPGAHVKHNEACGDNVGPLLVKKE